MTKKIVKDIDGLYHINGKTYDILTGSRHQVWNCTAYRTEGLLTKDDLIMNKWGRIVSKLKNKTAKKEKRLEKAGYFAEKGKFGYVKKSPSRSSSRKTAKNTKK